MSCTEGACSRRKRTTSDSMGHLVLGVALTLLAATVVVAALFLPIQASAVVVFIVLLVAVGAHFFRTVLPSHSLQPSAGSHYKREPNNIAASQLYWSPPAEERAALQSDLKQRSLSASTCMAGAYNPEFIDLNDKWWNEVIVPSVDLRTGHDDGGRESAHWAEITSRRDQMIKASIRPDPNIVWDDDDQEQAETEERLRTSSPQPNEMFDFMAAPHKGREIGGITPYSQQAVVKAQRRVPYPDNPYSS